MHGLHRIRLDIPSLRSGYRTGDFTPAEVVDEVYRRIADRGADDGTWIHLVDRNSAIQAAQASEQRLDLPLAGIPFAIKDNIDVAGMPTTAGCPKFSRAGVATATVVQRLQENGAILIGKTNMDQFATGLVGVRSPFGIPRNPFGSAFIPGGSSSGSAVAVAGGLVSFSLGTDTAGSGRVPAAFNNIVGLKPTRGLLSTAGVVPACRSLDCISIFALTVADAEAVMDVAAAFDPSDPYSRSRQPRAAFRRAFRFGVPRKGDLEFHGDVDAENLFRLAVERLETIGGRALEIDYSCFREAAALLYQGPWVAERFEAVGKFITSNRNDCHPVVADIITQGANVSGAETFRGLHQLEALRGRARAIFSEIDFLALPTTPTIFTIDQVLENPKSLNSVLGIYTNFVNLLDLAAIALPGGFRGDGLPLGVSLVGPAFSDPQLCAVARSFTGLAQRRREQKPTNGTQSVDRIELAVVGAHLSGFPLNYQLTDRGAYFVEAIETSPDYALFSLPNSTPPKPGMVRVNDNRGVAVEVEVWSIPTEEFGSFVAEVPPPLAIGSVKLADGRYVKGFLCEEIATHHAEPISAFGGWRTYLEMRRKE